MPDRNTHQKIWAKIVTKAWEDGDYKARLLADPAAILRAEGIELAPGVEVKIAEATENQVWFVLPAQSSGTVIAGEERLAAGNFF